MGESEPVAFRIPAEMKAEWQEAVEKSAEYDSVTHLIKKAVNRELHGGNGGNSETGSGIESEQIEKVLEAVEGIDDTLGGMKTGIDNIQREVKSDGLIPDEQLEAVYTATPQATDAAQPMKEIAATAGIDETRCEMVLAVLRNDMGVVEMKWPEESDAPLYRRMEGGSWS